MTITAINGSPKGERSNSRHAIAMLARRLPSDASVSVISQIAQYRVPDDSIFPSMASSDVLVVSFPLYVDGVPASLMRLLERYTEFLESPSGPSKRNAAQRVFAIVNCGFYEGEHNEFALRMLAHWCEASALNWRGGIGIGTGEMISGLAKVPDSAGIRRPIVAALDRLARAIGSGAQGALESDSFAHHGFPWLLFKLTGEHEWRARARANGLRARDLYFRALDRSTAR